VESTGPITRAQGRERARPPAHRPPGPTLSKWLSPAPLARLCGGAVFEFGSVSIVILRASETFRSRHVPLLRAWQERPPELADPHLLYTGAVSNPSESA
jgi:hypothetical protein